MNKLVLWGAGGHAKVVLDAAELSRAFAEIVFIDDAAQGRGEFQGRRVLGTRDRLGDCPAAGYKQFLVAIGPNAVRAGCFLHAIRTGLEPCRIVHPAAVVAGSARIGAGTVVLALAVVNASAQIGTNCIVNTAAIVEHDCCIGDHVHLSPGVVLGGGVRVGAYAHMGIGSIALPGVEIGEGAVVGAGAVVLDSVPAFTTVVGIPARIVHEKRRSPMAVFSTSPDQ